jgi:type II secretory pathway pseudopilin PulG
MYLREIRDVTYLLFRRFWKREQSVDGAEYARCIIPAHGVWKIEAATRRQGDWGAWIAAGAVVLAAVLAGLFTLISPIVQDWHKERAQAKAQAQAQAQAEAQAEAAKKAAAQPPKKKMKQSLCTEDPQTKQPYKFDIPAFDPKPHVDMNKPLGGDGVNPGHAFTVKVTAPGLVYKAVCRHDGTHEEITYCDKDSAARGGDTKVAEVTGWINGAGGPTYMTVFYQMPSEVRDNGD